MDYAWYLFGFKGRLNRANVWLALPIILCLMLLLSILAMILSKLFDGPKSISINVDDIFALLDPELYRSLSAVSLGQAVIKAIGTSLFLWIYLAIAIKRLHDRNKSAWWMLLFFVFPGLFDQFADRLGDSYPVMFIGLASFALCLWGFIELLFLKGTTGPNRFGADPLTPIDTRPPWDQQSEIEMVPHKAGPPAV
jgi:uncharacterized membrane protein YhaH (DUF805 family)